MATYEQAGGCNTPHMTIGTAERNSRCLDRQHGMITGADYFIRNLNSAKQVDTRGNHSTQVHSISYSPRLRVFLPFYPIAGEALVRCVAA